ncbi:PREDICTED: glutathione S-transferase T3-like [Brassica oleracea var. oleracea]|uniref:glutathione S-transferase T3-like n=1 Tax=Brassica oleracea var. oleracea TaxID=109376 RepID=UPI0006A7032B|nr:PREDICTED: glutathione S-transferase T3-like [Brassica oleracea var. oleracea]
MDSSNPFSQTSNFVDLLNSQQNTDFPETYPYASFSHGSSQLPRQTSSFCEVSTIARRERKKWTVTDDLVLISAWLNTSKDPVVGNEQKACAFWQRIAVYFAASPKVERGETREAIQCKQRWQKMNDLVCKFCGAYAAATRQKTSCQNEADTVKLAHGIFYNDHKIKFNLHHAWEELRNDQKWCEIASSKIDGSGKKRKYDDGAQSESSQATSNLGDQPTNRPPGVKAAKGASGKRSIADHQAVTHFQTMCSIKEKDLAVKEKDLAVKEKDLAVKEKDLAVKEKDLAVKEKDLAVKEKDLAVKEKDLAVKEKDLAVKEKDLAVKEKDLAVKEKDLAVKEKDLAVKEKDLAVKEKDLAVKEKDLAVKERVSKMSLLDSLISKKDSLSEAEKALKQKLLTEMLSN